MHSPREAALGLHQTADGFHAENFRPGACVLIQRNGERFWCVVEETAATKGIVNARVDQILLRNPSLMPGSLISFPKVDVLDLLTVDDFTKCVTSRQHESVCGLAVVGGENDERWDGSRGSVAPVV